MIGPALSTLMVSLLVCASGSSSATSGLVDDGVPFFTREEPHLLDAIDAVEAGDPDLAIEYARAAVTDGDDERAIVEYDVGQILVARARSDALAAHEAASPDAQVAPAAQGQAPAAKTPPKLEDARSGFERAAGLARDPRLISEAQLAAGNASLEMGKLEDAISSLRRALVADRNNLRARRNLQRALELKQQQPPEQNQGDDDKQDDKNNDDKKDGEQGDPQAGDQQQPGDEPEKSAGDEKKDEQKDEKKDEKKDQQQPAPEAKKKPTSKEEAKRILQGIRSRERPLTPMEMRGSEKQRPKEGKDW